MFVLSSLWEGSPNALTEALALGIPVVSTNCQSGPKEVLQDGKYGTLVPMGNSDQLAEAVIQTLNNSLPSEVLKGAVRHFTVQQSVNGYLKALGVGD